MFNKEINIARFLGIHINWSQPDQIVLTQVSLIERVISALNIGHLSIVHTQATKHLTINKDGGPHRYMYNYASNDGQLNYLTRHSCCDLGMATIQVAWYLHSPCCSYELALEQTGRYLKGTADEWIILHLTAFNKSFKIDVHHDAAFIYGWFEELGINYYSVKSRPDT